MRLFTAIDFPNEIMLRLDRLLAVLRPEALQARPAKQIMLAARAADRTGRIRARRRS